MDMLARERAKASLKRKGWSYRRAAQMLGYSFGHFGRVMSGDRQSATLFARIHDLPPSPVRYRNSGFARAQRRLAP